MRRAKTFDENVLHNTANQFSLRVTYKNRMYVEMSVPQYKIVTTLQSYLDQQPKRIDLFWSSAPVFHVIVDDLNSQNLSDFERLEVLIKRCPWLYVYSFHPRKETNNDTL